MSKGSVLKTSFQSLDLTLSGKAEDKTKGMDVSAKSTVLTSKEIKGDKKEFILEVNMSLKPNMYDH